MRGARQPHRPARLGRRGPDRPREPDPARPPARPRARARPRRAPTSCSRPSASPRPPAGSSRTTPAACAGGSTSPRASSSRRELMFLDEPTTGLDPRSRNQVWDIIRALRRRGHDDPALHPVPRRGRPARRRDRRDRPRQGDRRGHAGQLKASVGSGALHVRLLDPEQRAGGRARARARARAPSTSSPTRPRCRRRAPTPTARAEAVAELAARGHRHRGLLARPAEPRRGLPRPHRPPAEDQTDDDEEHAA